MNIYIAGLSDVPFKKRATDIRLLSFAKLFDSLGHSVTIINRLSSVNKCDMHIPKDVNIEYVCKAKGILSLFWGTIKEPFKLLRLNKKKKIDVIIVTSGHYFDLLIYKLVTIITKSKLVYHYCEYRSSIDRKSLYHKINGKLIDYKGPKLCDAAICISHFLENRIKERNHKIKTVIVPPICDFTDLENIQPHNTSKGYILFCGSVGYYETIDLIINAFHKSKINKILDLYLVLSGDSDQISMVKQKTGTNTIFFTSLEYAKLISLMKGASGLLIPLKNNIRDIARFPNKICEYIAAHGIVISTNFGEIPYYFKDKENALLANDFEIDAYANTLDWLCDNINDLDRIKKESYIVGKEYFNTNSYKKQITDFLSSIYNE